MGAFFLSVVHDFPRSRLELSIRVFLRTGGGHEVSGEETEGQLSPFSLRLKVKQYGPSLSSTERFDAD